MLRALSNTPYGLLSSTSDLVFVNTLLREQRQLLKHYVGFSDSNSNNNYDNNTIDTNNNNSNNNYDNNNNNSNNNNNNNSNNDNI